jgi:hypothetical protein
VLKDAAYRPRDVPIATIDVRLALRVLYQFMGGRDALTACWIAATSPRFHAGESCHTVFAMIPKTLADRGYAVNAELRL